MFLSLSPLSIRILWPPIRPFHCTAQFKSKACLGITIERRYQHRQCSFKINHAGVRKNSSYIEPSAFITINEWNESTCVCVSVWVCVCSSSLVYCMANGEKCERKFSEEEIQTWMEYLMFPSEARQNKKEPCTTTSAGLFKSNPALSMYTPHFVRYLP